MTIETTITADNANEHYCPFENPQLSNPYPFFQELRKDTPVFYSSDIDHWVVSRYKDVRSILRDYERFSARNTIMPIHPLCEEAQKILQDGGWRLVPALGNADRPAHTATRMNVVKAFTPKRIAALEPFIREITHRAVDKFEAAGKVELMAELIIDLPALAILKMLGFSDEQAAAIKAGARNRVLFVWGKPNGEQQVELARGLADFFTTCRGLVDERLKNPTEDLTSELLRIRDGDDEIFTLDIIASILFAFFTAGHETSSSAMGNIVRRLLESPDAWKRICDDVSLIPGAIEELLRFDSSVIGWRRMTKVDVDIAGVTIPKDAQVLLLLGSANHDETQFDEPEKFDIARTNAREHLSFGSGIHHCLGAPLARQEIKTCLEVLGERLPGLRLAAGQEFSFLPNIAFRGPQEIHVEW